MVQTDSNSNPLSFFIIRVLTILFYDLEVLQDLLGNDLNNGSFVGSLQEEKHSCQCKSLVDEIIFHTPGPLTLFPFCLYKTQLKTP